MTGLTGLSRLSSKPELCQFWMSTPTSAFAKKEHQHLDWKHQAKDLHMRVQHQTTQCEKKTCETKHECYNLLNCKFEE